MSGRRMVYALTSGVYSDFRVHAIFERRGDAEAAIQEHEQSVDELPWYGPGEVPQRRVIHYVNAEVGVASSWDREPRAHTVLTWDFDQEWAAVVDQPRLTVGRPDQVGRRFVRAVGVDAEATMKVVADQYAKLRAERDGL